MPLEIRELVIRAVVERPVAPATGRGATLTPEDLARLKAEIISECMDRFQRTLNKQQRR
ncbi:MAG: DUF5908 family protein [Bacteroidia bacterium]|jgi:hypothetical protein|nr:DUF5908 family protein [Bacteroidia bacterium]